MNSDMPNPPMSNAPMMPPAGPTSMFQTWMNAVTKPNEATYAAIASSPGAKATTAFLWVFIGSLIQSFLAFLVQGAVFRRMLEQQGYGNQLPTGGFAFRAITVICGAPIFAVITVVFFAIGTALIQWVAKMFGGRGTFDQMAYVFAAIAAPAAIVSGVFSLLGAIPFIGACFGILAGFVGLYVLVLEIMATKAVNGFGYGQAAGSVLIPGAVILLVCCCLAAAIGALTGAALGNVLSQFGPGGFSFPTPTP